MYIVWMAFLTEDLLAGNQIVQHRKIGVFSLYASGAVAVQAFFAGFLVQITGYGHTDTSIKTGLKPPAFLCFSSHSVYQRVRQGFHTDAQLQFEIQGP